MGEERAEGYENQHVRLRCGEVLDGKGRGGGKNSCLNQKSRARPKLAEEVVGVQWSVGEVFTVLVFFCCSAFFLCWEEKRRD